MNIAVYIYVCSVVEVTDVNYPNVWISYFPPYISVAFLHMWDSIQILFFCAVCTVTILPMTHYCAGEAVVWLRGTSAGCDSCQCSWAYS